MTAPDLYRLSATTQHMSALGRPKQRKLLRKMSRSMYTAAGERSQQAQQLFDASMYRLQQNIKTTLAGAKKINQLKAIKSRQEQQIMKIQEYQTRLRSELDTIGKIINRNRFGLEQQNVRQRGQMYRSINDTMRRQLNMLQKQGQLDMQQQKIKQEMLQVEDIILKIQESTAQQIDKRAETQALYRQALQLGIPFNRRSLKGMILKELHDQLKM
jgi:ATP-dependent Lon protease